MCNFRSLVIALLVPLAANAQSVKSIGWREDTKLASEKMIVVERAQTYRSVYSGQNNGWLFQSEQIKAILPPTNRQVVWEGRGIRPLALDVEANGDIYLVATVETAEGRSLYKVEKNHVAFKKAGSPASQWERIPVEAVPPEIRPNLLVDTGTFFLTQGHATSGIVDVNTKKKVASHPGLDERYRGWATK